MRDVDVFVVGAGPAGAYAAYALAKQGFTVLLAEKRPEGGVPVRCGEAAGSLAELAHFLPLAPEWMAGPIDGARLFGPSGHFRHGLEQCLRRADLLRTRVRP